MKKRDWLFFALPLLMSGYLGTIPGSLASQNHPEGISQGSEERLHIAQNEHPGGDGYVEPSPSRTEHSTIVSQQNNQPVALSFKCGIYSGICYMVRPAPVGAYCVCHTPAGINYGVIIP